MLGFLSIWAPLCTVENKGVRACDRAIFQCDRGDRNSTESSGRMRKTEGFVLSWTQWFGRFLINGSCFLPCFQCLFFGTFLLGMEDFFETDFAFPGCPSQSYFKVTMPTCGPREYFSTQCGSALEKRFRDSPCSLIADNQRQNYANSLPFSQDFFALAAPYDPPSLPCVNVVEQSSLA